jgi:hypothetical protein
VRHIDVHAIKDAGLIAADASVLSQDNNLVVHSPTTGTVTRIASLTDIGNREDPGDIIYAHEIGWELGALGSVLSPLQASPRILGDLVLSDYPHRNSPRWADVDATQLFHEMDRFAKALTIVRHRHKLRRLDIPAYTHQRLLVAGRRNLHSPTIIHHVRELMTLWTDRHDFAEISSRTPALVHGDLHAGNVIVDGDRLLLIDLDSVAIGPRLYDLAAWYVRHLLGDTAPIAAMIELARHRPYWSQEDFTALVGWKLLSSMTHLVRYASGERFTTAMYRLVEIAESMRLQGHWGALGGEL